MRVLLVCLLAAISYAQTDKTDKKDVAEKSKEKRCEDDPFGVLQANAMTCATLLNLAVCGNTLGDLNTNELCPKSCDLCGPNAKPQTGSSSSGKAPQAEKTPTNPDYISYDCGEGYTLCDEDMQRMGVNCALNSCTPRMNSQNGPNSQGESEFDCQEGRGQYGKGNKQKHISSRQECQLKCHLDQTCIGFDFNTPSKGGMMCRLYAHNNPRYGSSGKTRWTYCSKSAESVMLQKARAQIQVRDSKSNILAVSAIGFLFGVLAFLFLYTMYDNVSRTKSQQLLKEEIPL